MGWFKDKESPEEETEKEEVRYITDYSELVELYQTLTQRMNIMMDDAGQLITPLQKTLLGDKDNDGLFDELKDLYRYYPMVETMSVGRMMNEISRKSVDLILWYSRFSKHMKGFVYDNGLKYITESAFKMVHAQQRTIEQLKIKVDKLENVNKELLEQKKPVSKGEQEVDTDNQIPFTYKDKQEFDQKFEERWGHYEKAVMSGNTRLIPLRKGRIFQLCGNHKEKRKYCTKLFEYRHTQLMDKLAASKPQGQSPSSAKNLLSETTPKCVKSRENVSETTLYVSESGPTPSNVSEVPQNVSTPQENTSNVSDMSDIGQSVQNQTTESEKKQPNMSGDTK